MKKRILALFFLLPVVSVAQRKDCRIAVRDSTFKEIIRADSTVMDSATFFKSFDSLLISYKVKAICLKDNNTKINFFFPWKSTIVINLCADSTLIYKLTSELVHAEQFSRRPLFYYKKGASGILDAFFRSLFKRKKYKAQAEELMAERKCSRFIAYLWAAYRDEYNRPGSFEFEAHTIIEPKIKKILWGPAKEEKKKLNPILVGVSH